MDTSQSHSPTSADKRLAPHKSWSQSNCHYTQKTVLIVSTVSTIYPVVLKPRVSTGYIHSVRPPIYSLRLTSSSRLSMVLKGTKLRPTQTPLIKGDTDNFTPPKAAIFAGRSGKCQPQGSVRICSPAIRTTWTHHHWVGLWNMVCSTKGGVSGAFVHRLRMEEFLESDRASCSAQCSFRALQELNSQL